MERVETPHSKGGKRVGCSFWFYFWIKSATARTLLPHNWTYEEMPPEPIGPDGTLLHGLERIWAYAAQNDRFYPVIAMPISLGEIYYGDALLQLRDLNAVLFEKYGINLHRRLIDLIRTPIEPVKITAIKEPAKNISIKKIVKYRLMAKFFTEIEENIMRRSSPNILQNLPDRGSVLMKS